MPLGGQSEFDKYVRNRMKRGLRSQFYQVFHFLQSILSGGFQFWQSCFMSMIKETKASMEGCAQGWMSTCSANAIGNWSFKVMCPCSCAAVSWRPQGFGVDETGRFYTPQV